MNSNTECVGDSLCQQHRDQASVRDISQTNVSLCAEECVCVFVWWVGKALAVKEKQYLAAEYEIAKGGLDWRY